jgi:hypothetical protein
MRANARRGEKSATKTKMQPKSSKLFDAHDAAPADLSH